MLIVGVPLPLGSAFAGYVPLASQSPYPIIVYYVAIYRPHLNHFFFQMQITRSQLSQFVFVPLLIPFDIRAVSSSFNSQ